jgi:hypothetical protein
MEDMEEALSAIDAARLVDARRSGTDVSHLADAAPPQSDGDDEPTYFGNEGVQRAQGYEPMRVANPVKEADELLRRANPDKPK